VEEMREKREAESEGITLVQLRERKALLTNENQGGADEVEVIGVRKDYSKHNCWNLLFHIARARDPA